MWCTHRRYSPCFSSAHGASAASALSIKPKLCSTDIKLMARKATQGKGNKKPLYACVYEELVERIRSGHWMPGQRIPNEFQIAAEQGVSQGTARKAVSRLAAENLVVRVQGLGTFVVEPTPEHFQFRFFNVFDANGKRVIPRSHSTKCKVGTASRIERMALDLRRNARVIRFQRLRMRGRRPFVTEFHLSSGGDVRGPRCPTAPDRYPLRSLPEGLRGAHQAHRGAHNPDSRRRQGGCQAEDSARHTHTQGRAHRLCTERPAGRIEGKPLPSARCALPDCCRVRAPAARVLPQPSCRA